MLQASLAPSLHHTLQAERCLPADGNMGHHSISIGLDLCFGCSPEACCKQDIKRCADHLSAAAWRHERKEKWGAVVSASAAPQSSPRQVACCMT